MYLFQIKNKSENFRGSAPAPFGGLRLLQNPQLSSTSLCSDLLLDLPNHFFTDTPPDNQVPPDEGFELFDGDGNYLDVDYDEELESERDENNSENAKIQPSENIENDNVNTKEPNHYYRFLQKPIVLLPMPDEKY